MGKKTDYKRLWRNSKSEIKILLKQIERIKAIRDIYIDVLCRVRDGKLKPDKALKDIKIKDNKK